MLLFFLFCIGLSAVNGQSDDTLEAQFISIVFDSSCNISFDNATDIKSNITKEQFEVFFGQTLNTVYYEIIVDTCEPQKVKLLVSFDDYITIRNETFTWTENETTCNSIAWNNDVVLWPIAGVSHVEFLYELSNCTVNIETLLNDFDNAYGNIDRYSIHSIEDLNNNSQKYFIRNGTDVCFNDFTNVEIENVSRLGIKLQDNITFGDYKTPSLLTLSDCQVSDHQKFFRNTSIPSNNFFVNWKDCQDFDNYTYNNSQKEQYRETISSTLSELLEFPGVSFVGDYFNTYRPSFNISVTIIPFEISVSLNTPLWVYGWQLGFLGMLPTINETYCNVELVPLEADTFLTTTSSNDIQLTSEVSTEGSTGESDDSISVSTPAIIAFSVGGTIIIGAVAIFIYKSLSKDNYNIINLV